MFVKVSKLHLRFHSFIHSRRYTYIHLFIYSFTQIIFSRSLPYFFGLSVDVVVEDGAHGGEFDGLEFVDPPFGKLNAIVHHLNQTRIRKSGD